MTAIDATKKYRIRGESRFTVEQVITGLQMGHKPGTYTVVAVLRDTDGQSSIRWYTSDGLWDATRPVGPSDLVEVGEIHRVMMDILFIVDAAGHKWWWLCDPTDKQAARAKMNPDNKFVALIHVDQEVENGTGLEGI